MRVRLAVIAAVVGCTLGLVPRAARAQCVDEELKQELIGGRHYRGVQDRLFIKAFRHEFSFMGGWYAADLYSSNYVLGGAYTFHFSEDLALEASFQYTRFHSDAADTFNQRFPTLVLETASNNPGLLYFGHVIWSYAYGKLRWLGGGISRFDFNIALGAGVTDNTTSIGVTGSAGLGTKWYFGKWFAVRFDVRDHVLQEELIGQQHLVNDIIATLGLSVFVPFVN